MVSFTVEKQGDAKGMFIFEGNGHDYVIKMHGAMGKGDEATVCTVHDGIGPLDNYQVALGILEVLRTQYEKVT